MWSMKILVTDEGNRAFTRGELLTVIGSVVLLAFVAAGLLLPLFARAGSHQRISCMNNLRQIGVAFRTWEGDYNDLYPMAHYTNQDGTMKYANAADAFRYFQVMSNELNRPRFLVCPEDKTRIKQKISGRISAAGTSVISSAWTRMKNIRCGCFPGTKISRTECSQ